MFLQTPVLRHLQRLGEPCERDSERERLSLPLDISQCVPYAAPCMLSVSPSVPPLAPCCGCRTREASRECQIGGEDKASAGEKGLGDPAACSLALTWEADIRCQSTRCLSSNAPLTNCLLQRNLLECGRTLESRRSAPNAAQLGDDGRRTASLATLRLAFFRLLRTIPRRPTDRTPDTRFCGFHRSRSGTGRETIPLSCPVGRERPTLRGG